MKIRYILLLLLLMPVVFSYNYTIVYNEGYNRTQVYSEIGNFTIKSQQHYCDVLYEEYYDLGYYDWIINQTQDGFKYLGNDSDRYNATLFNESLLVPNYVNETVQVWIDTPCNYTHYKEWLDQEIADTLSYGVEDKNPIFLLYGDLNTSGAIFADDFVQSDVMISSDYLYASKGYYEPNISKSVSILLNTSTLENGDINKSSYPDQFITDVRGTLTLKIGVALDFAINILKWIIQDYINVKNEMCVYEKRYSWCEE